MSTILFLSAQTFESKKTIRGAFLLTDFATKPLEFRCTNPIRPTQLQSVLYGEILEEHVLVELVASPLFKSVKAVPDLILIKDINFLSFREKVEVPIIFLTKEEQFGVSSDRDETNFQMLNSLSGKFDPIIMRCHANYHDDMTIGHRTLSEIFNNHDLLEPFDRISLALEQVHEQKVGDSL